MGVVAVLVIGNWAPAFLPWLLPVAAGLLLAPPLAVYSSRRAWGVGARRWRLFLTPEEATGERSFGKVSRADSTREPALSGAA